MIICTAVIILAVALDQLSKWLVVTYLPGGGVKLIGGVLRLTYVENRGAAFGMLAEHRWVFIVVSTAAIAAILAYLYMKKPENRLLLSALLLIAGGGIGNMIDRLLLGYVIDFIDFYAFPDIWVWVFNIADACVCVGAGLMILYLIVSTLGDIRAERLNKAAVGEERGGAEAPGTAGTAGNPDAFPVSSEVMEKPGDALPASPERADGGGKSGNNPQNNEKN